MAFARGRLIPRPRRGVRPADILATLPTPVLVLDQDCRVTEANVAAEALLNASRTSLAGRAVEELIGHPLTSIAPDQPFAAYDLELVLPGGRRMRADLMAAPMPEQAGWRSITIHGTVPAHLAGRRGDREGGASSAVAAAAMLAHEIKNPLSGIRGAAQLLNGSVGEQDRALTVLIRDEVDRVTALIDRMESFTDSRPLALEPVNIHAILGHVRDVSVQGFASGRTIREVYDPSLPDVLGQRDALVQIFMNLVKNAVEAMGDKGTVTLTTRYRHGLGAATGRTPLPIEVCVIDEGPGADPQVAAAMFDPFVTTKRSGGGLGLALVEKLVGDLGGAIEYAREGSPVRTVLRVLLPRARG